MGRSTALLAGLMMLFGACTTGGGDEGDASCAFVAHFRGQTYEGMSVRTAPEAGELLGTAVLPACNDTEGNGDEGDAEDEEIEVAHLPGVSPEQALAMPGRSDMVLVAKGAELPREVARLVAPPGCRSDDAPIELAGPWVGILGADGKTELDLVPPYDVDLFVENASNPRYERASLTVRVPPALGRPLSREDVRSSLWEGGIVAVVATCAGAGYVAEQIEAHPPR